MVLKDVVFFSFIDHLTLGPENWSHFLGVMKWCYFVKDSKVRSNQWSRLYTSLVCYGSCKNYYSKVKKCTTGM